MTFKRWEKNGTEVLKEGIPIRNSRCVICSDFLPYKGSQKEIWDYFQKTTIQVIFKTIVQPTPGYDGVFYKTHF